MTTLAPLFRALALCVQAHDGQIDRDGKPHALHCIRVAEKQTTEDRMVLALLHDVVEDSDVPVAHIEADFGREIARKILLLTRMKDQSYIAYIRCICTDLDCMLIKKADIEDNTRVERVDIKAAKKMPIYKEAHAQIVDRLRELGAS